MTRRFLVPLVLVAAAVGGCGGSGSNGEADKSPAQILTDAKQAARDAGSVRVAGTIHDQGSTLGVDLRIGKTGGAGTMTIQGVKVDIVRTGGTVYVRAPAAFYDKLGAGKGVGQLLDGKWLKAPASSKDFADLAQLTSIDQFIALALKPEGKVTKGSETTVEGQKAIELKDSKGGSLFVATKGKPYPVEFEGTGSSGGKVTLTDWGKSVDAKAPKSAIDISQLGSS